MAYSLAKEGGQSAAKGLQLYALPRSIPQTGQLSIAGTNPTDTATNI